MKEEIKRLPIEFTRDGNSYRLYRRGQKGVVYETWVDEMYKSYEVFKIKISKRGPRSPHPDALMEVVPSDSRFGEWAWACHCKEKALDYFWKIEKGKTPGYQAGNGWKGAAKAPST